MNTSADAAEQIVRMTLNGAEVALRITGSGSGKAAKLIYKVFKSVKNESTRTKGAIRLVNLARSGKKLDVTGIMDNDLKSFCTEAKKYGILYTVLKDRNRTDGMTEIMYKAEDKEKLGLVFDKLEMTTCETAEVSSESKPEHSEQDTGATKAVPEVSDPDSFIDELFKKAENAPAAETEQTANPAKTRTSKRARSGKGSETKRKELSESKPDIRERRSVRQELKEIRTEQERRLSEKSRRAPKAQTQPNEHRPIQNKKKYKER